MVMTGMITGGLWITRALGVAAELGIADLIPAGTQPVEALAASAGVRPDMLYRLLRALASVGVFAETEHGVFTHTPLSETLRSDRPGSLRPMAILWSNAEHWLAWSQFTDVVRTGRSGFELAFGKPLFAFFAERPVEAELFNQSMTAFSAQEAEAVASAYDFSSLRTLVDVGGGHGLLLRAIVRHHPTVRGVLYDLPSVIQSAPVDERDQRIRAVAGNFFDSVPEGADGYILKNILHDFQDAQAIQILASCRRAMAADGRVLVVQEVLPVGNAPSVGKLMDMQMMLIGGKERTEAEYRAIFQSAGLRLVRVVPTQAPLQVIEAALA
jgi:hypothetical protein